MQRKRLPYVRIDWPCCTSFLEISGTQRMAAWEVAFGFLVGSTRRPLSFLGNPLESANQSGYGIYLGTRQEYRLHDYMISGSLFDNQAPFVLKMPFAYKNGLEAGFSILRQKMEVAHALEQHFQRQRTCKRLNATLT